MVPLCSSRYNNKNSNLLSWIQYSLALGLNSKAHLPPYIVVFLDNDLLDYLQYKRAYKVASLLGDWLEYLAKTIQEMIQTKLSYVPLKAQPKEDTQVYWVEPVIHKNFKADQVHLRETLCNCLDSVLKEFENMPLIKIKEFWDKHDNNLVMNNWFTKDGLLTYWRVMDATFKFNVLKHRDYLIHTKFKQLKVKSPFIQTKSTTVAKQVAAKQDFMVIPKKKAKLEGKQVFHDDTSPMANKFESVMSPDSPQRPPPSIAVMFQNMEEFFHRHQEWKQCNPDSFEAFHDKLFNRHLH